MKVIAKFNWEIESIALQRENLAVMGSKLAGNIWDGWVSLINFTNDSSQIIKEVRFDNGIKDGVWHGGKLYVASDSGEIFCLNQDLTIALKGYQHNDAVVGIDKKGNVLVSADNNE